MLSLTFSLVRAGHVLFHYDAHQDRRPQRDEAHDDERQREFADLRRTERCGIVYYSNTAAAGKLRDL